MALSIGLIFGVGALATAGGAALASKGGGGSLPPPPAAEPVTPMPSIDDQAVQQARRRSAIEQRLRRGRQSTILSDQSLSDQPLGG